ncbi:MAG: endonuclease, partial [Saprospiraceae bacterium]|nr:endonuclease [Saprospiraceae bacterium]
NGGVSTGGVYAFNINSNNRALGFQPTGSDFTPGNLGLKIQNNTGSTLNEVTVTYTVYVRNDQSRGNSFNFSYSTNNSSYTDVTAVNIVTPAGADSSPSWTATQKTTTLSNINLAAGSHLYLRWTSNDVNGSGSRDEIAIDDILIETSSSAPPCSQPSAQPSNFMFGTITSNLIQGDFSASNADKYLVVYSTANTLTANPIDGVNYPAGSALGNGTVVQSSSNLDFTASGLSANTSYFFYVFAYNDNCSGGPDYINSNPLAASTSTLEDGNSDYYALVSGQTCFDLKTVLYNIVNGHNEQTYGALWTIYQTTDDHLNDAGNATIVWDMYSDNPTGSENEFTFVTEQCGTYSGEGVCYNREHSFPKSWWGGSESATQYTDVHMVIPVDGYINGIRSNYPYGEVQSGTESHIMNNGSRLGNSSITIPGYTSKVFEPIDAYKGDIARIYFYMATRYENEIGSWENNTVYSDAMLNGTNDQVYEDWALNMLIQWHEDDPVSPKELDRNNDIFNVQGNRNPFVDHPEYVSLIWGTGCSGGPSDTEAPTTPSSLAASGVTASSVDLTWNASTDNVAVTGYRVYRDGTLYTTVSATSASVVGLSASTGYSFYVTAIDAAGNESAPSNTVAVTTDAAADTEAPTAPTSLTGNNVTTSSVDLTWSGSTDNVAVTGYNIYQNGSLTQTVTGTSATMTGLAEGMDYNYVVTAIDAAGNQSGASNTLTITTAVTADTQAPTTPTGLLGTNVTQTSVDLSWNASTDNLGVGGYDLYQDGVYQGTYTTTSTTLNTLTAGTTYLFYVVAFDAAGNTSGNSSQISITTDSAPSGPVTVHEGYFESGWDGWSDGGGDCARYSGSRSFEGNYSIRIRDNSGTASAMTSPSFDLSGFNSVTIDFNFYSWSMENGEDFWLRYNNGSGWQTLETYARGTDFQNNNFYNASFTIPANLLTSNAQFRFQCDASGNRDHIYIDQVIITGETNSNARLVAPNSGAKTRFVREGLELELDLEEDEDQEVEADEVLIYPNPAINNTQLTFTAARQAFATIRVVGLGGETVLVNTVQAAEGNNRLNLDVTSLRKGTYLVHVEVEGKRMVTKLVVSR